LKRFLSIFLTFILIFNFSFLSFSYANTIEELNNVSFEEVTSSNTSSPAGSSVDTDKDFFSSEPPKAGILTKFLDIVLGFLSWLYAPIIGIIFTLPTIDGCIFGAQSYFQLSFFDNPAQGLVGSIQGYVGAAYNAFRYLVTAVYIVVLVYIGIRIMLSSVGRQKARYKETLRHWLIGLLLIFSFHWVMAGIIWLSNSFVNILHSVSCEILNLKSAGLSTTGVLNMGGDAYYSHPVTAFISYNITQGTSHIPLIGQIIGLILFIILLGSTISILFTYLKRLFSISLLILLFPFVALSYVFDKMGDKKAQTLSYWFKEFTVNVMIQPIHALLLALISIILSTGLPNGKGSVGHLLFGPNMVGAICSVVTLFLIPTGEKLLKQLFQISSSMGAGRDGIAGSAARAGMALHGAQKIGSTFANMGKQITANHRLRAKNGLDARTSGRLAYKNAIEAGQGRSAALAARDAARQQARANRANRNSANYKNYLADLRKETGMKSSAGATAKAVATIGGMAFGAGTAITSSDTLSGLAGNIATHSALGGSAAGWAADIPGKFDKVRNGDALAAKDHIARQGQIHKTADLDAPDAQTTKLRHKIAAELGIDVSMVKEGNRQQILADYAAMERYTRFGGTDKDTMMSLTSNGRAIKNIQKGLMPDGSGDLDPTRFTVTQTTRGTFIKENGTDNQYYMAKGNPRLRPDEEITLPLGDILSGETKPAGVQQYVENNTGVKHAHAQLASDVATQQAAATRLAAANDQETSAMATLAAQEVAVQNAQQAVTNAKLERDRHPGEASYREAVTVAEGELHKQETILTDARSDLAKASRSVDQALTQYESATRRVESSTRNAENATQTATDAYSSIFSAANEAVTDAPHAPATPEITYSNASSPPAEPVVLFGLVGPGAPAAMAALDRKSTARILSHGDYVTIDGHDYPDCTTAGFSGISGPAVIVKKDGQWYVKSQR